MPPSGAQRRVGSSSHSRRPLFLCAAERAREAFGVLGRPRHCISSLISDSQCQRVKHDCPVHLYLLGSGHDHPAATAAHPTLTPGQSLWGNQPIGYQVYLDTDLSRPWPQYRKEFHPDFEEKFVLPDAPFLIKLAMPNRNSEAFYHLRVRRFSGAHRWEAIQLVPGQPKKFSLSGTRDPAQHQRRVGAVEQPRRDVVPLRCSAGAVGLHLMGVLLRSGGSPAVLAVGVDDGVAVHQIDEVRSDGEHVRLDWNARPGDKHYLTVRREDVNQPLDFEIEGAIPVTLLIGGQLGAPEIVCAEETSGWGSDDLALSVSRGRCPRARHQQ